jgi:signal peptidase
MSKKRKARPAESSEVSVSRSRKTPEPDVTEEETRRSTKDKPAAGEADETGQALDQVNDNETEKPAVSPTVSKEGSGQRPAGKRRRRKRRRRPVEEEDKPPTLAGRIFGVISTVLCITMFVLCAVIFVSAIANPGQNGISIGPFRFVTVLTGSMEPAISRGALCVVQHTAESDIEIDDIMTRSVSGGIEFVTHRVIEFGEPGYFFTRGDANRATEVEGPFHYDEFVGKVILSIPMLGSLVNYSSSPMGMGLVIVIFVLFFVFVEIIKRMLA